MPGPPLLPGRQNDFIGGFLFSDGTPTFQLQVLSPDIHPPVIEGNWLDSREVAKKLSWPNLISRILLEHKTPGVVLHSSDEGNLFWACFGILLRSHHGNVPGALSVSAR